MKKVLLLLIVGLMIFLLLACDGGGGQVKPTPTLVADLSTPTPEPTPKATNTPTPTIEAPPEEAYDIAGKENIAFGKYVEANGQGYTSEYWNKDFLTDGFKMEDDIEGQTTGWMSETSPFIDDETWVYVDLDDLYHIEAVVPYPRESEMYFPVNYDIQLSIDAKNWITVRRIEGDEGLLETDRVFAINPREAQYVRILVTERYDKIPGGNLQGYIAELSEIEVYGSLERN